MVEIVDIPRRVSIRRVAVYRRARRYSNIAVILSGQFQSFQTLQSLQSFQTLQSLQTLQTLQSFQTLSLQSLQTFV